MDRELTLDELLNAPIVCLLMRRDGIEAHEIRALMETIRRRAATDRNDLDRQTGSVESSRHTESELLRCDRREFDRGAESMKRFQRPPRP